MIRIEVIVKTDYRDVYQIEDDIFLVVNKFKYVAYDNGIPSIIYYNIKPYNNNCDGLTVMTKTIMCNHVQLVKGTILYHGRPVKLTDNKEQWEYNFFAKKLDISLNQEKVLQALEELKKIISDERGK